MPTVTRLVRAPSSSKLKALMTARHRPANLLRVSGFLVLIGALLSGPGAMLVVTVVAPQPAWTTLDAFLASYHPVQALHYALGFILLIGLVFFSASCHALAPVSMRVRTSAALVFTGIYASLVFTNYTIQLGYVPRVQAGRPDYLSLLTMANPESFAWFLEMFGYAAMGIATWLVAPAFGGSPRSLVVRWLLLANGVLSVIGAACTAAFDRWVFSTSGLVSFAVWNVLVIACFSLIAASPTGALALPPQDSTHAA
mgnify:FL=1